MRRLISKPVRSERIDCPLIVLHLITDAGDIANLLTSESIQALDRHRALPRGAYDHEKGVPSSDTADTLQNMVLEPADVVRLALRNIGHWIRSKFVCATEDVM